MNGIQFDELSGEWAAYSALTGRTYYASTRERAARQRTEGEEMARRHWQKCPSDYQQ